jgi:hypothetical protein
MVDTKAAVDNSYTDICEAEQTNRKRRHGEIYKKQKNSLARSCDADG